MNFEKLMKKLMPMCFINTIFKRKFNFARFHCSYCELLADFLKTDVVACKVKQSGLQDTILCRTSAKMHNASNTMFLKKSQNRYYGAL